MLLNLAEQSQDEALASARAPEAHPHKHTRPEGPTPTRPLNTLVEMTSVCSSGGECDILGNLRSLVARPAGAIGVLDGIRALAVAWVLAFHSLLFLPAIFQANQKSTSIAVATPQAYPELDDAWYMTPIAVGETGVDMFFLLSGFLIAYLLGKEARRGMGIGYLRFLVRRWLRIVPAYVAVILVYFVATPVPCFAWFWSNLLFLNNFIGPQVVQGAATPNSVDAPCLGHAWSIAVEFQMYILSPPLIMAIHYLATQRAAGARGWLLPPWWTIPLAGIVVSCLLRLVLWLGSEFEELDVVIYDKPYTRWGPYLVGMAVAQMLGPALDASMAKSKRAKEEVEATAASGSTPLLSASDGRTSSPAPKAAGEAGGSTATTSVVPTGAASAGGEQPLPAIPVVPCERWSPVIYWVGVGLWVLLSWAKLPFLGGSFVDQPGKAFPQAMSIMFFRTLFGLGVGMALFGIIVARLQESRVARNQQRSDAGAEASDPGSAAAGGGGGSAACATDSATGEPADLVDPCRCCPSWALGRWPASARSLAWCLELKALVPLARVSYSVYLIQFIPMFIVLGFLDVGDHDSVGTLWIKYMVLCGLTLVLASVVGVAVYVCVERPCMSLRERCNVSKRAA